MTMTEPKMTLDHLALPSFDPDATHRFYTKVMGFPLVFALDRTSSAWKRRYLLTAYAIGDGRFLDFFTYEGIVRPPPDDLPKDIRHIAFAVDSHATVEAWRARAVAHGVEHFTEDHGDDVHLYLFDPNGHLLEVKAGLDAPFMTMEATSSLEVLSRWIRGA